MTADSDKLIAGRFRVHSALGRGGQGAVFRGEMIGPQGFSREVAIKRLLGDPKSQPATAALLDEARLASAIRHPNVVQTLEIVEDDDELVVIMELVDGISLSALLNDFGPLPPRIAATIVEGALRGLHAAHEVCGPDGRKLNVIHRDFSPQNVIIDRFGTPKVLDFGIAKATSRSQPQTKVGRIKGKVRYIAPEQIYGGGDRRVDVWAAGVVLWETLVARPLFPAETASEVLANVLAMPIVAPHDLDPSMPRALSDIAMRALERKPERRFETAAAMANALVDAGIESTRDMVDWMTPTAPNMFPAVPRLESNVASTVSLVDATATAREWPRRIAGLALFVALAAVATISTVTLLAPRAPPVPIHIPERQVVEPAPEDEPKLQPDDKTPVADAPEPSRPVAEPVPIRKRPSRDRRTRPKETPPPDCREPWTYQDGVKVWKRECFKR